MPLSGEIKVFCSEKTSIFFQYKPKLKISKGRQSFAYEAAFHMALYIYVAPRCVINV